MNQKWIKFKINQTFDQKTVRVFLEHFFIAHKKIYKLEMDHAILVNKKEVKTHELLHQGDEIEFDLSQLSADKVMPYKGDIEVVYEDEDFLVLNKPRACLVYSDGTDLDTLTNRVAYHYHTFYPILPIHRIDYDTTGLVLFAKHGLSLAYVSKLFEEDQIEKTYDCVVENDFIDKKGVIKTKIARDRHDQKMRVSDSGKDAFTSYEVIGYLEQYPRLKVMIKGGRKHQIRVHLRSIGHPIISDLLYGHKNLKYPNLMLHFSKIKFIHPRTLEYVEIVKEADF